MFEIPVQKNYNELTFATSPTVSSGSITTLGLNYSKIGVLIHGQYIFQTTGGNANVVFMLPIKSYYALTIQDSLGASAPVSFTVSPAGKQSMLAVSASITTAGQVTCRFIGSDSHTLTPNVTSRALTLNHGKRYSPPLTVSTGSITGVVGYYQYVKYPIKLLMGQFTTGMATTMKYPTGPKTTVLESYITSNATGSIGTVVSGSVGSGGISFSVAGAGTHTFLILLRERGF